MPPWGQVMEAFGTLVSNVQVAVGQVRGITCLPLPPDPRVYADGKDEASLTSDRMVAGNE